MKWIIALLLLLNIALFGYFHLTESQTVGVLAGHEAIQPEKIRILTPDEVSMFPKKAEPVTATPPPVAPPASLACYDWGSFAAANVSRVKNILDKLPIEFQEHQTASQEGARYWIYIPPLPNAEKAQAKNDELRGLGVEESFVVQEPQWRNAISLGVFKDETLANKFLADLHARGVKSAIKGTRNHEPGQASFHLINVPDSVADEIGKLRPDFPRSEFKKVDCK
jgi:hypothetical protein